MKAGVLIRLLFYLAEAGVLMVPIGGGLLLVQNGARRFGLRLFEVTRRRLAALFLAISGFDAITAELFGPQVILQYYAAAIVLAGGACCWIVGVFFSARSGKLAAPDPNGRKPTPHS